VGNYVSSTITLDRNTLRVYCACMSIQPYDQELDEITCDLPVCPHCGSRGKLAAILDRYVRYQCSRCWRDFTERI
jgi:ribosomal protein S27AE